MTILEPTDEYFMRQALIEAEKAFDANEVPIGAIVVSENKIIARAHNLTERLNDCTAHAEMQAFTSASDYIGGKYLDECTLYVTLEPCLMCAGAAKWVRIGRLVYGAVDKEQGFSKWEKNILHPKTVLEQGPLVEECSTLLTSFFSLKRK